MPDLRGLVTDPGFDGLSDADKRDVLIKAGAPSGFIRELLAPEVKAKASLPPGMVIRTGPGPNDFVEIPKVEPESASTQGFIAGIARPVSRIAARTFRPDERNPFQALARTEAKTGVGKAGEVVGNVLLTAPLFVGTGGASLPLLSAQGAAVTGGQTLLETGDPEAAALAAALGAAVPGVVRGGSAAAEAVTPAAMNALRQVPRVARDVVGTGAKMAAYVAADKGLKKLGVPAEYRYTALAALGLRSFRGEIRALLGRGATAAVAPGAAVSAEEALLAQAVKQYPNMPVEALRQGVRSTLATEAAAVPVARAATPVAAGAAQAVPAETAALAAARDVRAAAASAEAAAPAATAAPAASQAVPGVEQAKIVRQLNRLWWGNSANRAAIRDVIKQTFAPEDWNNVLALVKKRNVRIPLVLLGFGGAAGAASTSRPGTPTR